MGYIIEMIWTVIRMTNQGDIVGVFDPRLWYCLFRVASLKRGEVRSSRMEEEVWGNGKRRLSPKGLILHTYSRIQEREI